MGMRLSGNRSIAQHHGGGVGASHAQIGCCNATFLGRRGEAGHVPGGVGIGCDGL